VGVLVEVEVDQYMQEILEDLVVADLPMAVINQEELEILHLFHHHKEILVELELNLHRNMVVVEVVVLEVLEVEEVQPLEVLVVLVSSYLQLFKIHNHLRL
jgi:hypothetical protein